VRLTVTAEERRILLADARESIAAALEKRSPSYTREAATEENSALAQHCGAFVTLHIETDRGRRLRGCIGRMTAAEALEKTVRVMAVEAAFSDPRFPPLSPDELPRCHIEISALSPLEPCPDPRTVQVGVHGLYLIRRGRSGVLLPQVPVEQGWNRDEYLDYICVKAGLPPHSYDAPDGQLSTFTAVVFGEA
jgi:AmmeMemoRadiSam system protein A